MPVKMSIMLLEYGEPPLKLLIPIRSAVKPAAESAAYRRLIFADPVSVTFFMKITPLMITMIPRTKSDRNTPLQPECSIISPANVGPATEDTSDDMEYADMTKPCFSFGYSLSRIICPKESSIPQPNACKSRLASRMGKSVDKKAASEPAENALMAERKYILLGIRFIRNAVIGRVTPEIRAAPPESHWARSDEMPKYAVKFGIIFPVTAVDIDVKNAAARRVISIPVLFISGRLVVFLFIPLSSAVF